MKSIYQNRTEPFTIRITQNNSYAPHLHREIELFYVLDGEIEITIDSATQILSAGMASIAFPNVAHKTHTETSSRAILVIFPPELLHHSPLYPYHSLYNLLLLYHKELVMFPLQISMVRGLV